MDILTVLMVMTGMGAIFGLFIGWFYFNTFRFVSFKRSIQRKNFGIVYFVTKGKALFPVIKDFNKDIIRTHKGVWFFRAGSIYRQVDKEQNMTQTIEDGVVSIDYEKSKMWGLHKETRNTFAKHHYKFTPNDIEFRQGCPIVFLDIDDMVPLHLEGDALVEEPKSRNPYQVEAVLGKEVAAAELEAIKMTKKNMQYLLIAVILLVIVGIAISVMTMNKVNTVGEMVYNLTIRLP